MLCLHIYPTPPLDYFLDLFLLLSSIYFPFSPIYLLYLPFLYISIIDNMFFSYYLSLSSLFSSSFSITISAFSKGSKKLLESFQANFRSSRFRLLKLWKLNCYVCYIGDRIMLSLEKILK